MSYNSESKWTEILQEAAMKHVLRMLLLSEIGWTMAEFLK